MATTTHGDLAADAAAYLAESASAVESLSGNTKEIDRQAACLVEWARKRNVLLTDDHTAGLEKHQSTTAEHEVFYRVSDNRAVKRTHAGTFGVTNEPKGKQRHATPLFYLRRLELMNRVFGSDLQLEGVTFGKSFIIGARGEKPCLVISQPWIDAADENNPHPTETEIEKFMESLGFSPLTGAFFGWRNEEKGITVLDARPDNFINSPAGVIPIDLVISRI
jgi:Serine/Threonine/Tyrosine Kinase found in polyvalent proteins